MPVMRHIDEEPRLEMRIPIPPVVKANADKEVDSEFDNFADPRNSENVCRKQLEYLYKFHDPVKIMAWIAEI